MQTVTAPAASPANLDLSRIAQDLQIRKIHVENVVQLLDEGNTVPFITRYRKERTGGLDEEKIRIIQRRIQQMRQLADRKQTILKSIESQGKLTDELRAAILAAESPKRLEDLYLPFKPKKRTLATEARERGLEPLALAIWTKDPIATNLPELFAGLVNPEKQLNTPEDVLAGVKHILSEIISELAPLRGAVRAVVWDTGMLTSTRNESLPENRGLEYKSYFQFQESAQQIPPHRILAINRGEKENALKVKIDFNAEKVKESALQAAAFDGHPHQDLLKEVLDDALTRLVLPSLEREVRRELTDIAHEHAVKIFARNLRSLLMQPPLHGKRILGIDPGLRTGCKLAVLDETGNMLDHAVIYPHQPQNRRAEAKRRLEELLRKHQLSVVAIGNGTACRETEKLVSELIAELESRQWGAVPPPAPEPPPAPPAPPVLANRAPQGGGESAPAQPVAASMGGEAAPAQPTPSQPAATERPAPPTEQPAASAAVSPELAAEPPPTTEHAEPLPTVITEIPPPPSEIPAPAAVESAPPTESPAASEPTAPAEATAPATAEPAAVVAAPAPPPPPPKPTEPEIDWAALPLAPADLSYVIVNEAGASDYSASPIAKEEFPEFDATLRGTISIGRRLQDPLSELVKIDPQHVGVGLYQHDVRPKHLKESLESVVESCVNNVGVDLNTASVPLLRHVSGLNQLVARELVEHRKQHGPFKSRQELLQIPGVGAARFTQAAGFLKIGHGEEPLDETWIHPESYEVARTILADTGFTPQDIRDREKLEQIRGKLKDVHAEVIAQKTGAGMPTIRDVFEALAKPSRDPRDELPPPIFRKGILKIEDLQPGMELKGTVLNVVDFGAFVDIGLKDSGLVHISQMANRYIKNPYDVVAVGDVVTVWVRAVDMERRHVSLSMISPQAERKPPERRPERPPRPPREHRPEVPAGAAPAGQDHPPQSFPPRDRGPRHRGGRHRSGHRQPAPAGAQANATGMPPPVGASPPAGDAASAPPVSADASVTPAVMAPPPHSPHPQPHRHQQHQRPPRREHKPKPLPKLSQAALKGQTPLHSFGELEAFFKAKETPAQEPAPTPPPAPAVTNVPAPVEATTPPPPAT
ncbi:MAG TPA: Tex-like N-terminal domain-containing protein [Gemmataceae bacterium]|nr:Tex-like N-terminal domain-containing protein [Gemmataceae bacterium]